MNVLHRTKQTLNSLLPAYLNHTLSATDQRRVEAWLSRDPQSRAQLAVWQQLRAGVIEQPHSAPSTALRRRLMARVQTAPKIARAPRWLPWTSGLVMAALVLIALWVTIRPGIGLQWSVSDDSLSSFMLYRAPFGSSDFTVVSEIPAQPGIQNYTYVDTSLSLDPNYTYLVEGDSNGVASASPMIMANAQGVLRDQLLILAISLMAGLGSVMLGQYWLEVRSSHALHRMAS